jgi:hypothetical protein
VPQACFQCKLQRITNLQILYMSNTSSGMSMYLGRATMRHYCHPIASAVYCLIQSQRLVVQVMDICMLVLSGYLGTAASQSAAKLRTSTAHHGMSHHHSRYHSAAHSNTHNNGAQHSTQAAAYLSVLTSCCMSPMGNSGARSSPGCANTQDATAAQLSCRFGQDTADQYSFTSPGQQQ